jgi:2-hydroxy-3-keto-5-methylthiopentenyl-1-phosphate phosphatase
VSVLTAPTLALDWDGTCTLDDSLVAAVRFFGDAAVFERRFGSLRETLTAEVGTIRAGAAEVAAWAVATVELRPGLHELVERGAVIVSSGLETLIRPVLAREGISVDLRCNDAVADPAGWRLRWRNDRPCPVCGDACKRSFLPHGRPLVYVGDGISDHCAALAADRVFARAWLAETLRRAGVPYEPYETLSEVAASLP